MKSVKALSSASLIALGLWITAPLPALAQKPTATASDGSVLPFPPKASTSIAGPTLQESKLVPFPAENRLPKGAPNILIILLDDVGFGLPDTFGGPVHTPTLTRLAKEGISYNSFHTTSICSPTRAALLTGRNHQRVGSGTIAERAVNWDGYTGVIPRTSATLAKVLGNYGYNTAAFGKWHNTPATQTTAMGPFTLWPTGEGIGFDYFYGFLAGETSQWEPRLTENFNPIEPPHDEKYHLSEDLADKAIGWLRKHEAYTPDKPFLMYWATGAAHGPHHIFKEWADKYKGKFDAGWDELRERTFKRQKELGWIPASTQLTPRDKTMAGWDSIPASERAFQTRLMEIFAGFTEHADVQAGKVIDELDRLGVRDNTLVFYIFGDNGSSAEGQRGSISELLAQNGIPNTSSSSLRHWINSAGLMCLAVRRPTTCITPAGPGRAVRRSRAPSCLAPISAVPATRWSSTGRPASSTTRAPRSQFHHVNDIVPTIYDIVGIKAPKVVDGFTQDPMDGVSMTYTFADGAAKPRKTTQYFDNNGSRGIYQDGWFACTFGPFVPWDTAGSNAAINAWDANKDVWELYDLRKDFSQAEDLAATNPQKLAEMKSLFLKQAKANKAFPIGAGLWLRTHPQDRVKTPYSSWKFNASTTRMPEFTAPGLGRESNHVSIDAELGEGATGVLYALGGFSGGLTLYMDKGELVYEYNMMEIERYSVRASEKIAAGKRKIEVDTTIARPGAAAEVVLSVDGKEVARTTVKRTVPAAFTASESFDVGVDLGSPVSPDYFDRRPFRFDGKIEKVEVKLK